MARSQKKNKSKRLKDMAEIRTGMQARGYEKISVQNQTEDANARLIQAKDVTADLAIDHDQLQPIRANPKLAAKHWLAHGQILFFGRVGQRYAIYLDGKTPPDLLADKVFFVIHNVRTAEVRADYLTWFLNSAQAQAHFNAHETGSRHGIISKSALQTLLVPVPDLKTQAAVAQAWACWSTKLRLAKKALDSEGRFIAARLEQAAWGAGTREGKGDQDETR